MSYTHPLFHDPALACGPPLDDALIRAAEKRLGRTLPAAYVDALRRCNGGPLRRRRLALPSGDELDIPDLIGIGYNEGLDGAEGSRFLAQEWDHPYPSLVLFSAGRFALLLDCRRGGEEPPACWADSDTDQLQVIAPSCAALLERLRYAVPGVQVLLPSVRSRAEALAVLEELGAVGPLREDWTGASILRLEGRAIRARPSRYRGSAVVPELPDAWVVEMEHPVDGLWERLRGRDLRAIRLSQGI